MCPTGFLHHDGCLEHDTGANHPERPERVAAVVERLRVAGLLGDLVVGAPQEVDGADLERIHDPAYLRHVEETCAGAPAWIDSSDTPVSAGSLRAARLSAGAATLAIDSVQRGDWSNAFVCTRPPGHHAERAAGMGFCLYNNVAVAAGRLRAVHGCERVAVLDWDVHHGNGTQHLFEHDPSVFYASVHQFPHYPGTGAASEHGLGAGEGATLNVPLSHGTGDAEWIGAIERQVLPALEAFRPEFLLISAGFDAHVRDPLSGTRVSDDGFRQITRSVLELAARVCDGRVVALLEGGYDLEGLASSVEAHVEELQAACG